MASAASLRPGLTLYHAQILAELNRLTAQIAPRLPAFTLNTPLPEAASNHTQIQTIAQQRLRAFLVQQQREPSILTQICHLFSSPPNEWEVAVQAERLTQLFLSLFPDAPIDTGERFVCDRIRNSSINPPLNERYPEMRIIRGDGNCFYTAFAVLFLNHLCSHPDKWGTFYTRAEQEAPRVMPFLRNIAANSSHLDRLLLNNAHMLPLIHYFRQITAEGLLANEARIAPFLTKSFPDFVQETLTMGDYADQHVMQALAEALQFPFWIVDATTLHETCISCAGAPPPSDTDKLLYKDRIHYDIVYSERTLPPVTRFTFHCPIPLGNTLFMRGTAPLSWDKGAQLERNPHNPHEWIVELPSGDFEYKFLLNDGSWEEGLNRKTTDPTIRPASFSPTAPLNPTRIEVVYPTIFGQDLFLRVEGNWGTDIPMQWQNGRWTVAFPRTDRKEGKLVYKVVLRDKDKTEYWQQGPNQTMDIGTRVQITPQFATK